MNVNRIFSLITSALPPVIIAGLLYAGLYIKPQPQGAAVARPVFERGDRLYGLAVQHDGRAWVAGSGGKIALTEDSGLSWRIQPSTVDVSLQDVAAWDEGHAVAVGDGGVVIVTDDGGKRWRGVEAPHSKIADKLMRVRTLAGGQAWAVGEGGSVLHSTDFGSTWHQVGPEEDIAWNDISFHEKLGWMVGEYGRIRMSSDEGASWHEFKSPTKMSLMSVAFKDARNGVAVGLNGVILVSHDSGESWTQESFLSPDQSLPDTQTDVCPEAGVECGRGRLEHLFDVIWDGDRWVAVGSKGVVVIGSADASTWKATRLSPDDRNWYTSIARSRTQYYLAGSRVITTSEVIAQ
jgi:photosystem II stability/assembly factor-like uncharacterized protein